MQSELARSARHFSRQFTENIYHILNLFGEKTCCPFAPGCVDGLSAIWEGFTFVLLWIKILQPISVLPLL